VEALPQVLPFGSLLKRYRRAANLTQEMLAERAGYSVTYLSKLERGERLPLACTVEALAGALGLPRTSGRCLIRPQRRRLWLYTPRLMAVPRFPAACPRWLGAPPSRPCWQSTWQVRDHLCCW
jgi:transcriptional regulator with XRE-family HTH domain